VKLSVITPSLNQHHFLPRTAASILSQSGPFDLEWLVIDAGSTDGTLEFLRTSSQSDPRIHFTSEPDAGQSDALNKGFPRATGDILAWLNADDLYLRGALEKVSRAFTDDPNLQWLIGRCQIIDADDRVIRSSITRYKNRLLDRFSYRGLLRENCISQPAVFFRRSFLSDVGPLDTTLHYSMDYDLWLRMARSSPPRILPDTLASFRFHPQSKSGRVNRDQFDEAYRVANRYFAGDTASRLVHRFHMEKIVWSYRLMRALGL
jgi:glycosyltransferase involved in cell wall biosynthesis